MGKKLKGAVIGGAKGLLTGGWAGAAAGAIGGAMSAKGKQRPDGTVTSTMPSWIRGQYDTALGEVNRIAMDPNGARRVAGLNADDEASLAGIRGMQGLGDEDLAYATGNARELSQGVTADEIRGFYNPFEQDVVDATQRDIDYSRQLAEQSAGSAATAASAFGGDREAVYKAQLAGDVLRSGGATIAGLRRSGFRDATNAAMASRGLRLSGNDQIRSMVDARRSGRLGDATALGAAGALQRGVTQAGYDATKEWNTERSKMLLDSLGALPGNQGTVNSYGPSQSSGARAGAGATGALGTLDDLVKIWRNRGGGAAGQVPSAVRTIGMPVGG